MRAIWCCKYSPYGTLGKLGWRYLKGLTGPAARGLFKGMAIGKLSLTILFQGPIGLTFCRLTFTSQGFSFRPID